MSYLATRTVHVRFVAVDVPVEWDFIRELDNCHRTIAVITKAQPQRMSITRKRYRPLNRDVLHSGGQEF